VHPRANVPRACIGAVAAIISLAIPADRAPAPTGLARLSGAFALFAIAVAAQLVPLPLSWVAALSPRSPGLLGQLYPAIAAGALNRHALSIWPEATIVGLTLFAANALMVVGCARLFTIRSAAGFARALTIVGLIVALAGIVQRPLSDGKIYGFWTPLMNGSPYGPFVNRNHFAGWMLMALPLTLGRLCGGFAVAMRGGRPNWRDRLLWLSSVHASKLILLAGAAIVMALSLVLTMSRSGITSLVVALGGTGIVVLRRQQGSARRAAAVAYLTALLSIAIGLAGVDVVASRFGAVTWKEFEVRRSAWRDAAKVASDFRTTGTGLNSYGVATLFYERGNSPMHFAEAHNDYLQLAAEGGLLLIVPATLCISVFVLAVRRRFAEETSTSGYWLRVGALTGISAIALQEIVDFSLQMPGNAALFAVLCGMALHRAPPRRRP